MDDTKVALLVPRNLVKHMKSALETHNLLNRSRKITTSIQNDQRIETYMTLYTNISYEPGNGFLTAVLESLGLEADAHSKVFISKYTLNTEMTDTRPNNPLLRGLKNGLQALPKDLLGSLELTVEVLLKSFPDAYSIYKPLLLLPPNAFTSSPWAKLLSSHAATASALQPLWAALTTSTGTTHLALNAGIPLQKQTSSSQIPNPDSENTFRSPLNLTPLYPPSFTTSRTDDREFSSALWVSHTQNQIHQIWAPLYTMFSRGNVKEKARLLSLPSITSSVANTKQTGGCTAVDLYAGIGYFAFSYRKAGVRTVLCWEVNEWSVEGFRRGAGANGWIVKIVAGDEIPGTKEGWKEWGERFLKERKEAGEEEGEDFVVFQQSNEYALDAVAALQPSKFGLSAAVSECERGKKELQPIRHVNCGFLPSSRLSWGTAVRVLDRELGGWIHAHENVAIKDIEDRGKEIVVEMQEIVDAWEAERGGCKRTAMCEHVEKVKTYAPGVVHVVFDVWVSGISTEAIL